MWNFGISAFDSFTQTTKDSILQYSQVLLCCFIFNLLVTAMKKRKQGEADLPKVNSKTKRKQWQRSISISHRPRRPPPPGTSAQLTLPKPLISGQQHITQGTKPARIRTLQPTHLSLQRRCGQHGSTQHVCLILVNCFQNSCLSKLGPFNQSYYLLIWHALFSH